MPPKETEDGYELIFSGEPLSGMSGGPILDENAQVVGIYGRVELERRTTGLSLYGNPINTAKKMAVRAEIDLGSVTISPSSPFTQSPTESSEVEPLPTLEIQLPEVGFEVMGSPDLNRIVIPMYKYTGDCPGVSKGKVRASFTSIFALPSENRRVIVRNVSRGIESDPFPYTDREYNRERGSEFTEIIIGTRHTNRYLIVREGENTFEYEIKEEETKEIVEQGKFTASVEINPIEQERNKEPKTKFVCPYNRATCKSRYIQEITVYECPSLRDVI